jgi:hypothetical protein
LPAILPQVEDDMYPLLAGIVLLGAMAGLRLGIGRFVVLVTLALPCLAVTLIVLGWSFGETALMLLASAFAVQLGYFLALVGRALSAGEPEPVVEEEAVDQPMADPALALSRLMAPVPPRLDPRG